MNIKVTYEHNICQVYRYVCAYYLCAQVCVYIYVNIGVLEVFEAKAAVAE